MKDIYKNPTLYYILAPIVVVLWPLSIWAVYLPRAERGWQAEKAQYNEAQKVIAKILALDPDRLDFAGSKEGAAEFDYTIAVDKVASSCKIPTADYKINSRPITVSSGQKSQGAQVVLKKVDVAKFAKFLSTIQLRWASLQCEKVKLTKNKGLPDTWKVDLDFKYYY
jgi:hypothetical protein